MNPTISMIAFSVSQDDLPARAAKFTPNDFAQPSHGTTNGRVLAFGAKGAYNTPSLFQPVVLERPVARDRLCESPVIGRSWLPVRRSRENLLMPSPFPGMDPYLEEE